MKSLKLPSKIQSIIVPVLVVITLIIVVWIILKVKKDQSEKEFDQYKIKPNPDGSSPTRDPRALIDKIYKNLEGYNAFYYPEIVNQLANLSDGELRIGYDYFEGEYSVGVGGLSLTEFIDDEWHAGLYDDAVNKLKRKNLL